MMLFKCAETTCLTEIAISMTPIAVYKPFHFIADILEDAQRVYAHIHVHAMG